MGYEKAPTTSPSFATIGLRSSPALRSFGKFGEIVCKIGENGTIVVVFPPPTWYYQGAQTADGPKLATPSTTGSGLVLRRIPYDNFISAAPEYTSYPTSFPH